MDQESKLMNDHVRRRVAVLLGAGASVDAGCPTVEDLVGRFGAFLQSRAGEREREALTMVLEVLDSSKPVRAGGVSVDIELLLSTLVQLIRRDEDPVSGFVRQWHGALRKYESCLPKILELLQEHIRKECTIEPARVEYLWPLKDLVEHYGALDVFTLNYDAAVEIVCQQRDIQYTDGFDLYWNPAHFKSPLNRLRLFKLHGSLLWYETQGVPKRLVKIPVKSAQAGGLQFFTDEEVSNVLMYPAFVKDQHLEPYATIVGYLRDALAESETFVAIGCSFRDEYLKKVILEKMTENPRLQLVMVGPQAAKVAAKSDEAFAPEWKFSSQASRVSFLHATASSAFAGDQLLNHLRTAEELTSVRSEHDRAVLAGDDDDADATAEEYVDLLVRMRHVGALAEVIQTESSRGKLLNRLVVMVKTAATHDASGFQIAGPAILIATLARSEDYRTLARDWFRQMLSWVVQYVVWGASTGSRHTNLADEPTPSHVDRLRFFNIHAQRVGKFRREFLNWLMPMQFATTQPVVLAGNEMSKDLELCEHYFQKGAQGDAGRTFRADFAHNGRTEFPQGDEESMHRLAERFDNSTRLPKSVSTLLQL